MWGFEFLLSTLVIILEDKLMKTMQQGFKSRRDGDHPGRPYSGHPIPYLWVYGTWDWYGIPKHSSDLHPDYPSFIPAGLGAGMAIPEKS